MRAAYLALLVLSFSISCTATISSGVYKLRSVYRRTLQDIYGDCFLLKTDVNKFGIPSNLYFRGHCCFSSKFTDFKVFLASTQRGLEGTFQWSHDSNYYLTAKRIGTPFQLEKITGRINDAQRFVLKSSGTVCQDCVTIKSVLTNRYMTVSKQGQIILTDKAIRIRSWFDLHKCDSALLLVCDFIDISC